MPKHIRTPVSGSHKTLFYLGNRMIVKVCDCDVLIDDEDFERFSKYTWGKVKGYNCYYICTYYKDENKKRHCYLLHRFLMNAPLLYDRKLLVDHINGDSLDNRKTNLRFCSQKENNRNVKKQKNCTSSYKGVCFNKQNKKWMSQIVVNGNHIYLGLFLTEEEAYKAYCEASKKHHGDFGRT